MGKVAGAAAVLLLGACAPVVHSAACDVYGMRRAEMPRPLPDDPLGRWVALTDAGLTGACR